MEEWKSYKLGDIASIQTGPFGSQLHQSDYVNSGVPCIMPTNIGKMLDFQEDGIAYIKEVDAQRLSRHIVHEGEIIYSRRGDIEKCAYVSSAQDGWFCGTGCLKITIDSNAETVTSPVIAATAANEGQRTITITPGVSSENNSITTYYTTDGSTEPTSSSTKYTGTFTIDATTTIKAISISSSCV